MSSKQGNVAVTIRIEVKRKPLYEKKPLAIGRDQECKRREESTAKLRRIKRIEGLKNKRCNVAPSSSSLVASPSPFLLELQICQHNQALWTPGNIAGDCPRYRDVVLSKVAMPMLLYMLREGIVISMLKIATWTLSNFCCGRPLPAFELVKAAIPTLAKLIYEDDKEVLDCGTLTVTLQHQNRCLSICTSALRFIGNLAVGTEAKTQLVIDSRVLLHIYSLMTTRDDLKQYIKKDICWVISNIAAGTKDQIQVVIDSGIIPLLVMYIEKEELDIKEEVVWALCNTTFGEDPAQIEYLVKKICMKPICGMLSCSEVRIMSLGREAIKNILRASKNIKKDTNKYRFLIREAANMNYFIALRLHWNPHICEKAGRIVHAYLADAESNEVQRTRFPSMFFKWLGN